MIDQTNRFLAVMPTYNQEQFFDEAVESVIDQVDILCIVDDASTDSTPDKILALEKSRGAFLHMRHATNQRTAEAINSGVAMLEEYYPEVEGSQDWLTWVSSDNIHHKGWVDTFRRVIDKNKTAGVIYTGFTFGPHRKMYKFYRPNFQISREACILGPSFFVRRDVWRSCGGHRGKLSHDLDHFLRLEETCQSMKLPIISVEEFPCLYRLGGHRATKTRRREYDAPHWIAEAKKRRGIT